VRLDTHALGLGRRDLRDRHFQHSIDVACLDLILLHVVRQREASQERAFHALEALESFLILTAFNVSLATQREHTVVVVMLMSFGSTPGRSARTTNLSDSSCTSTPGIQVTDASLAAAGAEKLSPKI